MGLAFKDVGGYDGMVRGYQKAMTNESYQIPNATCHLPDKNAFRMLREADDDYMPWAGFLLGQTPGSIWYWCADQVIVQRLLAAKSISHAKGATLMAGFIKILPLFMMVMPGMISRIKYPDEVACVDRDICYEVCQSYAGCTNIAYPRLVLGIMPEGLRGLMMAVMIAALMSDLDSIFNSASTLFTIDIYKRIRKTASVQELMIVGRIFIVVMIGVSIGWVPILKETQGGQVFIYIQEITNYLAPPFAAVFLLAVLVPMVNEKGAFWSLMIALLAGVIRMILVYVYNDSSGDCLKPDARPAILKNFHYMYFAVLITLMTALFAIVISYFTGRPTEEQLFRTTYWTRHAKSKNNKDDVGGEFDNIGMSMSDINEKGTSNGTNKSPVFNIEDADLKKYRDPYLDQQQLDHENSDERSCKALLLKYLCGAGKGNEEEDLKLKEHMAKVAELKQDKIAAIFLNIGLVFILMIGAFLYFFWSYWKYEP